LNVPLLTKLEIFLRMFAIDMSRLRRWGQKAFADGEIWRPYRESKTEKRLSINSLK